ncbi:hypothetical protein HH308_26110 [Gordonia sp. TBRC 11910]|uniref:Uncharacterized protein n=1 Tax=Gordonia asplenii TaxID=2725283 RepID=A0A848L899_9ACTN|nr:hypothetical protein [Gordonia asplenii]NMO04701.1 hypothetical protein [Gordonia asplenii]
MTPDDQYAKWLDTYTSLLIAELDARDFDIKPDVAREFIESTISMIATTTGTSEREARLSITETAVSAWATMLIEEDTEDGDFVAVSGVLFAALQTWASTVLPIVEALRESGAQDVPFDAAFDIAEIISLVEAGFLIDADFVGALELSLPADEAHSLLAELSIVNEWVGSPALAAKLSELDAELDLPEALSDPAGETSLADLAGHLADLGRNVVTGLDTYHRHLGQDVQAVLHYDDLEEA